MTVDLNHLQPIIDRLESLTTEAHRIYFHLLMSQQQGEVQTTHLRIGKKCFSVVSPLGMSDRFVEKVGAIALEELQAHNLITCREDCSRNLFITLRPIEELEAQSKLSAVQ